MVLMKLIGKVGGNQLSLLVKVSLYLFFFYDDLLLLAEASIAQAQVIKNVLNTFCMSTGEKVNNSKTLTFFSHNVHTVDVKKIGDKLSSPQRRTLVLT